jgi:hypothetical protein
VRFVALIGLFLFSAAQTANVTVEGTVSDSEMDKPLASVIVRLNGAGTGESKPVNVRATTGADGRFTLSAPPGEYTLVAHRDGYFGVALNGQRQSSVTRKITVVSGQKLPTVDLKLTPGGVITGLVLDPNGAPISRAAIAVMQMSYRDGSPALVQIRTEDTNERGEYRIYWVPPGEYLVAFNPSSSSVATATLVSTSGPQSIQMRTFYPGTMDISKARPVSVTPGSEVASVNFGVKTSEVFSVSGKVVNPLAAPDAPSGPSPSLLELPGFTLVPRGVMGGADIVMSTFANSVGSVADRQKGLFELRSIPAGQYELFAIINTPSFAVNYAARMSIDLTNQSLSDLTISVHPLVELRGRIQGADNGAGSDKRPVRLSPAENFPVTSRQAIVQSATVEADGTFTFKNLMEGSYRLEASPPSDAFVSDIRQGNESRYSDGIVRVSATASEPIQVTLTPSSAHISGTANFADGKFGTDTTVVLVPDAPLRKIAARYRTARADENGKFTLTGLAPGPYKLFAWEGAFLSSWLNDAFLAQYEDKGFSLEVMPAADISGLHIQTINVNGL